MIRHFPITILGITLERWTYRSCCADIAEGDGWATIYFVLSHNPNHGEVTYLLAYVKAHYERLGVQFGGSVALNDTMRHIYRKLGIEEYTDE